MSSGRKRGGGRGRGNGNCFECDQPGHLARDCPTRQGKGAAGQANGGGGGGRGGQRAQFKAGAQPDPAQKRKPVQGGEGRPAPQAKRPAAGAGNPPKKGADPFVSSTTRAYLTDTTFASLPISVESKRAITEVLGYDVATKVQRDALGPALDGRDLLAKAKTGTGKTLGFLIPSVERLARAPGGGGIRCLIMSPTRELACQIQTEAEVLLRFHRGLRSHVVYGGTNVKSDVRALQQQGKPVPSVLVGTPGRLEDLLANHGLQPLLRSLEILILDEADQLLDYGFRPQIERVLAMLPGRGQRQTLLFSATFPPEVRAFAASTLNPDHQTIDAVGQSEATVSQVTQHAVQVADGAPVAASLWAAVAAHRAENPDDYKTIVFFVTARLTQYYAELFNGVSGGQSVFEIHSRKSQAHRTRVADQFRRARSGVMFSSDVSARGMDYPDVTMVVQVGKPSDRAQYVHRTGRTARAGKKGEALLLLRPFEWFFIKDLRDLPLVVAGNNNRGQLSTPAAAAVAAPSMPDLLAQVSRAAKAVPQKTREMAYQTWLGYYNSSLRRLGWSKPELVVQANKFAAEELFCPQPPALLKRTVGKMGLKGVPGLRLQ